MAQPASPVAPGQASSQADAKGERADQRPEAARRLVRFWDFEDKFSRVEPVPIGWFRAQDNPPTRERLDHPAWNTPVLSDELAYSGERSLNLPTQGGNTSLILAAGVVPALPEGDYAVLARVRTRGMTNARAFVTMRFLDAQLRPIKDAESRSAPVISEGSWSSIEADLRGSVDAAWVQVELQVMQPSSFMPPSRAGDQPPQDFRASAFFDDVVIYQVPRLLLDTQSPGSIVVSPEAPTLTAMVRDLTGEALTLDFIIYDAAGSQITAATMPAPPTGRRTTWTPDLPRYGWYRAVLRAQGPSGPVGERHTDFIWAPPALDTNPADRQSFGVIAERLTATQLNALPELLKRSQAGATWISVWPSGGGENPDAASHQAQRVAERMLDEGVDVTFSLLDVPMSLARAAKAPNADPIALFLLEGDPWLTALSRILSNFGERVRRWQFGGAGSRSYATAEQVGTVREKLQRLIPRPRIALPAALTSVASTRATGADSLLIRWPLGIAAGYVPAVETPASNEGGDSDVERILLIDTPNDDTFGRRAGVIEVARRAVSGWAAGYRRLAIDAPWTMEEDDPNVLMPAAELAAWRTIAQHLGGATIVGTLPCAEGLRVYIADTPRGGMLVGWNQSAEPRDATISGLLGVGPITVIDALGNDVAVNSDGEFGYRVTLDELPAFIEGVDLPLTRFRAAMRLEPGFLPARAEKHTLEVVIENPWPEGITGRIRLADPPTWDISPRVLAFNVSAGRSARLPVEFVFAPGEEAGPRIVTAEVELFADKRYPILRIPMTIEIGLPSIDLLPSYRLERSADGATTDVIVSAAITNVSDRAVTVEAFAQAPGYRLFEAPVSELQPGATATRRFRFNNGAELLRGRSIRVGIKEQDGTGRLNKTLEIN